MAWRYPSHPSASEPDSSYFHGLDATTDESSFPSIERPFDHSPDECSVQMSSRQYQQPSHQAGDYNRTSLALDFDMSDGLLVQYTGGATGDMNAGAFENHDLSMPSHLSQPNTSLVQHHGATHQPVIQYPGEIRDFGAHGLATYPQVNVGHQIDGQGSTDSPPWNSYGHGQPASMNGLLMAFPQTGPYSVGHLHTREAPSAQLSDVASVRSDSLRFYCAECNKTFGSRKALNRHIHQTAAHRNESDPRYICKCGKQDIRLDNFIARHLANCDQPPVFPSHFCICGYSEASAATMREHFPVCGLRRPRGRPPGSSSMAPL